MHGVFINLISVDKIGDDGVKTIADALEYCTCLEELNVTCINISSVGACSLARSFPYYAQCFHKLYIGDNSITSEGCKAITKVLRHCLNLKILDFLGNKDALVLTRELSHCTDIQIYTLHQSTANVTT